MIISNLAFVIYGLCIRFSHVGRVCSGDFSIENLLPAWNAPIDEITPYLLNMGHFMKSFSIGFATLNSFLLIVLIGAHVIKIQHKSKSKYGLEQKDEPTKVNYQAFVDEE